MLIQRILRWIREVLDKMINSTSVKQAMNIEVAMTQEMVSALQKWDLIYRNQSPWLNTQVKSLNLGAAIASEIARAVTIEMEVGLGESPRAVFLQLQFKPLLDNIRSYIEYGSAKGGGMFKPYVNGEEVNIDYVQADQFYPVAFDANNKIIACVFSDQRVVGSSVYTRLEYHRMEGKTTAVITNKVFKSTSKTDLGQPTSFDAVPDWADIVPEIAIANVKRPLFAYFRYPMANSIDPSSPLGVSCFSRATDLMQQADEAWSGFLWEVESAKRALFLDELAFGKGEDGKPIVPIKRLYRMIKGSVAVGAKETFEDWSPTIRQAEYLASIDAMLKRIEFNCGLSYGTISNPETVATLTATEIKMSKQREYATIVDTQKALSDTLDHVLYIMDVWTTLARLAPLGPYSPIYSYDDSIVTDHDTQFTQDSQAVTQQLMPKRVFLERNYDLTEEDAKKWLQEIKAEQPASFFDEPPLPGQG